MRPTSKVFRARQVAGDIEAAACKGLGVWWSQREAGYAASTTRTEARSATQPAVDVCVGCPEIARCALLAQLDRYTGIAAAGVYVNGRRSKTIDAVPQHPTPPHELKARASR